MGGESLKILFDGWIFHDIVAGKSLHRFHSEKLEIEVHRPEKIIQAASIKEGLIRIIEGAFRGIKGQGYQVMFAR